MYQLEQKVIELIKAFTKGKKHLKLNIGVLVGNQSYMKTFNETGEMDYENNIYEIGSITKTFTASLLSKYVYENKMQLSDPISKYIQELDSDKYYPSLLKLATHTSGYSQTFPLSNWENLKMTIEFLLGNDKKVSQTPLKMDYNKMVVYINKTQIENKEYKPKYSNFGIALLGYIIGSVSGNGYWDTMNDFVKNELGLQKTYLGTIDGKNLKGYSPKNEDRGNWKWEKDNLLLAPTGALSSTAEDLLAYAKGYLHEEKPYFVPCGQEHVSISKDAGMGLSWNLDKKNNIISHTGGTGCFLSCLAINKKNNTSFVYLSNYRSNMRLQLKILNLMYEETKK